MVFGRAVMDTGLTSLRNLYPVSNMLLRLCISEQRHLTEIYPPLRLPNLRDLLLHRNNIRKISGLEGCPKLQRLWLQSNRIERIEGLHAQGDLRELWIQDNHISRITGIEHLVNLQVLALGGNPINDLRDAQKLSHLPMLRSFSLSDVYFGDCPAVQTQGYSHYLAVALPALTQLDGHPITDTSRKAAEREMLVAATEFAQRVESVTKEQEEALDSLRARRASHVREAERLSKELSCSFRALGEVIKCGEDLVVGEAEQLDSILKQANEDVHGDLNTIEQHISNYLTQCAQIEEKSSLQEIQVIRSLQARAYMEREENSLLAFLSSGSTPSSQYMSSTLDSSSGSCSLIAGALSEHSPEFRVLCAHFFGDSTAAIQGGASAAHIQGIAPSQSLLSSIKSRTDGVDQLASASLLWKLIPKELKGQLTNTEPYAEDSLQIRKLLNKKTIRWDIPSRRKSEGSPDMYRIVKAWKLHHASLEGKCASSNSRSGSQPSTRARLYACLPRPLAAYALLYACLPHGWAREGEELPLVLFTHAEEAIRLRWIYDCALQKCEGRSPCMDETTYSGWSYEGSHCVIMFRAEIDLEKTVTCPASVASPFDGSNFTDTDNKALNALVVALQKASEWANDRDADHVIFPLEVREGSSSIPSMISLPSYSIRGSEESDQKEALPIVPEAYSIVATPSSLLGVSTYYQFIDQTMQQIIETVDQGAYVKCASEYGQNESSERARDGQTPGLKQLQQWEKDISSSISKHSQRVLLELNPNTSEEVESAAEEVVLLQEELRYLRDSIDKEKQVQENLLREQQKYSYSGASRNNRS